MTTTADGPRLAPLPHEQWDERLRRFELDEIINAYGTVAHHPRLFRRWLPFADQVLNRSTLSGRHRELLILRTGWLCASEYEWGQHVKIGRREGLTDEDVRQIAAGPDAPGWTPFEALLLRAVDEIHRDHAVSDVIYEGLARELDSEQLLDLVFAVGHYQLVSTLLNTFRVERDDGVTGVPFPTR